MEDILSKAFATAPGLAAAIGIVWIGSRIVDRMIQSMEKRDEAFHDMHREHLQAREEARRSIDEMNLISKEQIKVGNDQTNAIESLTDFLKRNKNGTGL